jgi:hypothetical protein
MDAFWTEAERDLRRAAAEHFRRLGRPEVVETRAAPAGTLEEFRYSLGIEPATTSDLGGRVAIVEEAARHDPRLGHSLLAFDPSGEALEPFAETALRLGRLAGTAAHVLDAGAHAARVRGAFASSLMGCRDVQESLAGLAFRAELARLGACRICRLIEKGDAARAAWESRRLESLAGELSVEVRAVALSLLGEAWVRAYLDADGGPSAGERTSR